MNNNEIGIFIEEMKAIGDEWTEEQVQDTYGDVTLEEALADRKASVGMFFGIIDTVINRNQKKRK